MNSADTISEDLNPDIETQPGRRKIKKKRKLRCRECMKMFSSKQSLREHKYSHTDSRPYMCLMCNKRFRYGSQLTNHKKKHLSQPELTWPTLTQMLKNYNPQNEQLVRLTEIVRLPPIRLTRFEPLPQFFNYFSQN